MIFVFSITFEFIYTAEPSDLSKIVVAQYVF